MKCKVGALDWVKARCCGRSATAASDFANWTRTRPSKVSYDDTARRLEALVTEVHSIEQPLCLQTGMGWPTWLTEPLCPSPWTKV